MPEKQETEMWESACFPEMNRPYSQAELRLKQKAERAERYAQLRGEIKLAMKRDSTLLSVAEELLEQAQAQAHRTHSSVYYDLVVSAEGASVTRRYWLYIQQNGVNREWITRLEPRQRPAHLKAHFGARCHRTPDGKWVRE